jgi:hypothetical protein
VSIAHHHLILWQDGGGTLHAYGRCPGAGQLACQVMTMAALTATSKGQVCECLRHRWEVYRDDMEADGRVMLAAGRRDRLRRQARRRRRALQADGARDREAARHEGHHPHRGPGPPAHPFVGDTDQARVHDRDGAGPDTCRDR